MVELDALNWFDGLGSLHCLWDEITIGSEISEFTRGTVAIIGNKTRLFLVPLDQLFIDASAPAFHFFFFAISKEVELGHECD